MAFKLRVGVMNPFVKQRTTQTHSAINKLAEAFDGGGGSGGMKRSPLSVDPIFLLSPPPAQPLACSVERQGSEGYGLGNTAIVNC